MGEPPFALKKEEKEGSNKVIKSAQPRQLSWRRRGGQSNPQRRRLPADSDETSPSIPPNPRASFRSLSYSFPPFSPYISPSIPPDSHLKSPFSVARRRPVCVVCKSQTRKTNRRRVGFFARTLYPFFYIPRPPFSPPHAYATRISFNRKPTSIYKCIGLGFQRGQLSRMLCVWPCRQFVCLKSQLLDQICDAWVVWVEFSGWSGLKYDTASLLWPSKQPSSLAISFNLRYKTRFRRDCKTMGPTWRGAKCNENWTSTAFDK